LLSQSYPLVQVDTYMMSKCPYATMWVNDFQKSVLSKTGLKDIVNVTMNYIAKVDSSQETGFYSLHGQTEVYGDFYELCVANDFAQSWSDWWTFVYCLDRDYSSIPTNAASCAQQQKIDLDKLKSCVNGDRAKDLMITSINITDSLGWNPRPGSPTVYINKKCVSGYDPCDNLTGNQLLKGVCNAYTGPKPAGCPK